MRKIKEIIVHCSATKAGVPVTVEQIREWHKKRNFSDIGYHFVIYLDGSVHKGRALEKIGAHTLSHNSYSVGICYVGGLDAKGNPCDTRTAAQKQALVKLISELRERFGPIPVHGHREFAKKACPCYDAFAEHNPPKK